MTQARRVVLAFTLVLILSGLPSRAAGTGAIHPKPVPRMQVVPLPYDQVSFRRDGIELTRLHFGHELHRPFLYPVIGPSGHELTRMGHPHEPESHSHHNSIWISHFDVNGVDIWGDRSGARVRHERILKLDDSDDRAAITTENTWRDRDGSILLRETRTTGVQPETNGAWLLVLDLVFEAERNVTFGKTPFGFIGIRMARSIGVNDGGGRILNSSGGVNEKEVFWKPARWVDYSGAPANGVIAGLTLFDHPDNPNHPSVYHVRDDGWMGASFSHASAVNLARGATISLRYGVWVHDGAPSVQELDAAWQRFASTPKVGR